VVVLMAVAAVILLLTAQDARNRSHIALTNEANAYAAGATVEWQATFFALQQNRAATLVKGGIILPAAEIAPRPTFIANLTQVAKLNHWEPVVDKAYQEQYGVEMVQVPAGSFVMGSSNSGPDEQPAHEVILSSFWIDRYEVTNEQFERLGGEAAALPSWTDPNQPRTSVTWYEAWNFCMKRAAELPTEMEWEYAARGPDSLIYPWGDELSEEYLAAALDPDYVPYDGPTDVGRSTEDISWVGAHDLSGNVSEWVSSLYSGEYVIRYPNHRDLGPGDLNIRGQRVVRGGSYESSLSDIRAAARTASPPEAAEDTIGFRCARSD
jgi:sulfatase modifying factor 1